MSTYDPANIFVVGEQFRNGSKWLILAETNGFSYDVGMAATTCSAFALELYLKALLAEESKDIPGYHDLRDLFDLLSATTQYTIRKHFEPHLEDAVCRLTQSFMQAGMTPPVINFDFVLNASRKAFPLTRYIYEKGLPAGQGWVANGVLEAARQTILELHPDWVDARQASPRVKLQTS